MQRSYRQFMEVAHAHEVIVNIEPRVLHHQPVRESRMLDFVDSPLLRMNLDTGNTFLAGQDPVAFAKRFLDRISHVHVKDVSASLAESVRGGRPGSRSATARSATR